MENNEKYPEFITDQNINKLYFLICDEIDTILNPSLSEFNYPIQQDDEILKDFYEMFIKEKFQQNVHLILSELKLDYDINCPWIQQIQNPEKEISEIAQNINGNDEETIEKEIDSWSQLYTNFTEEKIKDFKEKALKILRKNIHKGIIEALSLTFRKDYGPLESKNNFYEIVPYSFINKPIKGSEFINPYLSFILEVIIKFWCEKTNTEEYNFEEDMELLPEKKIFFLYWFFSTQNLIITSKNKT